MGFSSDLLIVGTPVLLWREDPVLRNGLTFPRSPTNNWNLTTYIMEQNWQQRPNRWLNGINCATWKLQIASSFQCGPFRLQRVKYRRDKLLCIAQDYLRPSKWHVRRYVKRDVRPVAKLRHSSEPPFNVESKFRTCVALPTRELRPDLMLILPTPQLEKVTAPNFVLNKDGVTDEWPLTKVLPPCCFLSFPRCQGVPDITKQWVWRIIDIPITPPGYCMR